MNILKSIKPMIISNRVKELIGTSLVARTVHIAWESGWQEYTSTNDDAIDGVILLRKGTLKPTDTGGIVFVQVKCGGNGYRKDQKQYPDHLCIKLGSKYIFDHRPRWIRAPGPMVLIFVDDTIDKMNPPAWWVNLKDQAAFSPTNAGAILIPKAQRFSHHSKGDFHKLCGASSVDRQLESYSLTRTETVIPKLGSNESLRDDAWNFYKNWRSEPIACINPVLGEILVNRVGWKHITRLGRLSERIVQSWLLLGAAKKIVRESKNVFNLGHVKTTKFPDGNTLTEDYLGLRATVSFPYRHQSIIQIVLKRSRLISPSNPKRQRQKIWFYSVYELRRGTEQLV